MSESPSPPNRKVKFPMKDDERWSSYPTSVEVASTLDVAEKSAPAEEYEPEWSVASSLQVLGGFMLLFNSYCS